MSTDNDLPRGKAEEIVIWRKRIPLKASVLAELKAQAKDTVRTPEGMVVFILEEYLRGGGKAETKVTKNG